jgi:membrane protease YdiL (CAAX protease family)
MLLERCLLLLVFAPATEEIVFRAGLQHWLLARGGTAARYSVVIVALIFASAHFIREPSWVAAGTVLPALAIGVVYLRLRSVAACSVLHSACNAVWMFLAPSLLGFLR